MIFDEKVPREVLWQIIKRIDSIQGKIRFLETSKKLHDTYFQEYRESLRELLSDGTFYLNDAVLLFEEKYEVYEVFIKEFKKTVEIIGELKEYDENISARDTFTEHTNYIIKKYRGLIEKIDNPKKYEYSTEIDFRYLNPILSNYLVLARAIYQGWDPFNSLANPKNADNVLSIFDWDNIPLLSAYYGTRDTSAEELEKLAAPFQKWVGRLTNNSEVIVKVDLSQLKFWLLNFRSHFLAKEHIFRSLIERFGLEKAMQYADIVRVADITTNYRFVEERLNLLDESSIKQIAEKYKCYVLSDRFLIEQKYFEPTRKAANRFETVIEQIAHLDNKVNNYSLTANLPKVALGQIVQLKLSREELYILSSMGDTVKDWSLQEVKAFIKTLPQVEQNVMEIPGSILKGLSPEEIVKLVSFISDPDKARIFQEIKDQIAPMYHLQDLLKYFKTIERLVALYQTIVAKSPEEVRLLKLYTFWPELTHSPLFKVDPNNIPAIVNVVHKDEILSFVLKNIDYIEENFDMVGDYSTLEWMVATHFEKKEWCQNNEALLGKYYSHFNPIRGNVFSIFKKYIEMIINLGAKTDNSYSDLYKSFSVDQFKQNLPAIHLIVSAAQTAPSIRPWIISYMAEIGISKFFEDFNVENYYQLNFMQRMMLLNLVVDASSSSVYSAGEEFCNVIYKVSKSVMGNPTCDFSVMIENLRRLNIKGQWKDLYKQSVKLEYLLKELSNPKLRIPNNYMYFIGILSSKNRISFEKLIEFLKKIRATEQYWVLRIAPHFANLKLKDLHFENVKLGNISGDTTVLEFLLELPPSLIEETENININKLVDIISNRLIHATKLVVTADKQINVELKETLPTPVTMQDSAQSMIGPQFLLTSSPSAMLQPVLASDVADNENTCSLEEIPEEVDDNTVSTGKANITLGNLLPRMYFMIKPIANMTIHEFLSQFAPAYVEQIETGSLEYLAHIIESAIQKEKPIHLSQATFFFNKDISLPNNNKRSAENAGLIEEGPAKVSKNNIV